MHMLHRVLIRVFNGQIPNLSETDTRDKIVRKARDYANYATESYCGSAFDYRSIEDAGRWCDQYPENVLLSREDIGKFTSELMGVIKYQRNTISKLTDNICRESSDLRVIVQKASTPGFSKFDATLYRLHCLSNMLSGIYDFDAGFFDAEELTARITPETIDEVMSSPKDWALVLFDHHS